MNQNNILSISRTDYIVLPFIMALAFYLAFLPHHNYPYPVHIDEWVHLAYFEAMLKAGGTSFAEPFLGQGTVGVTKNLEAGFHLFWGVFHQISGISWLDIFKYFPGIVFIITVLSIYVLARREGFGWEAAFFTCLIPTTLGILGPGFLVPMCLGLPFIPLSLFLVFNFRTAWSYLVLFIFVSFLLAIHAPTAIGLAIILIPYILLNLKGNFKHSLITGLVLAIPFLAPFPWIFKKLGPTAQSLLTPQPFPDYIELPLIIQTYGQIPIILCLVGTFLLAFRGGRKNYGLIIGLLLMLVMLATFYTFQYGVSIMYERGLTYMMLAMGIVAGAGLMWVKNIRLPAALGEWLKAPIITENIGKVFCLGLIVATLVIGIPVRQDIPYYNMISKSDYAAFVWIRENVDDSYQKAILDPWKATAFTAITGKNVHARTHAFPTEKTMRAYTFLRGGCDDTSFLKDNGISLVYTPGACNNPDLVKVRTRVYLLKEDGGK